MMFGIGYITKEIRPCTKALFYEAVRSRHVKETCAVIARLEKRLAEARDEGDRRYCTDSIAQAKRSLPCITPMATFRDNRRSVKNAIQSGLNMVDVDHVENPRALWEAISKKSLPYKVCLAHVTPSTHGLRIIFVQPAGKGIAEAQADMARAMDVEYDGVTKDLARCSFLVCEEYILYINEELWNVTCPLPSTSHKEEVADGNVVQKEPAASPVDSNSLNREEDATFKGIPYSEIIAAVLYAAGYDVRPMEGERNNALYLLARNLRYICDFNTEHVMAVLPDWGLPCSEVRTTVESAVKSVRRQTMPEQLAKIINALSKQYMTLGEQYGDKAWDYIVDAQGIIGEFVNLQPRYLKNACYLACMASFATLLTRLRGKGMNGDVLAPNFMVTISAPQASGKSFMVKVFEQICAPIAREDERQRKIMKDIDRQNRRNAGNADYEEKEFRGAIRLLPSNTSNRILIERMDKADKQHLMIVAPEIDSMTKAEKAGKWSEKSDVYRLAYDNDRWGTDYASENSYNAVVNLYLNLLFSGTPAAMSRFFNDIENGLITRFLFCDLPDTFGMKRPQRKFMDEETRIRVDGELQNLYELMQNSCDENGEIWIDTRQMVEDVGELYDERQRRVYLLNQLDPSRDLARRRYADYAVKMMMIETYLNGGVYTEEIRDRVIGMIDYCTEQILALHGDAINRSLLESCEAHEQAKVRSRKKNLLESLPDTFSRRDFEQHAVAQGYSINSVTRCLMRLVQGAIIERTEHGLYRKI